MFGYLCWGIQSISFKNLNILPTYGYVSVLYSVFVNSMLVQIMRSELKNLFESWLCHLTSLWIWNYSIHQVSVSFSSRVGLQNVNGNVTCKIWHSKPGISGFSFFPPFHATGHARSQLPDKGWNPGPPHRKCAVLTTGPPQNSLN